MTKDNHRPRSTSSARTRNLSAAALIAAALVAACSRIPKNIIRLLQASTPIREAVFGVVVDRPGHLDTLRTLRNHVAHFQPISPELMAKAFESAERLLRAIRAIHSAERIVDLREHGLDDAA